MNKNYFDLYFKRINESCDKVNRKHLCDLSGTCLATSNHKGKIILAGNGGSAAMASHVAVDFTKAAGVRAINFNEADLITCFANDFGYSEWIAKSIEYYADPNDLIILISSSGQSKNMLSAAETAKKMDLNLVTFSGFSTSNPLRKLGDMNFYAESNAYNIVEMTHHIWLLAAVDYLIEIKNAQNS